MSGYHSFHIQHPHDNRFDTSCFSILRTESLPHKLPIKELPKEVGLEYLGELTAHQEQRRQQSYGVVLQSILLRKKNESEQGQKAIKPIRLRQHDRDKAREHNPCNLTKSKRFSRLNC